MDDMIDLTKIETKDKLPSDVWLSEDEKQRRRDERRREYRESRNKAETIDYSKYARPKTKEELAKIKLPLQNDGYDDLREAYNEFVEDVYNRIC